MLLHAHSLSFPMQTCIEPESSTCFSMAAVSLLLCRNAWNLNLQCTFHGNCFFPICKNAWNVHFFMVVESLFPCRNACNMKLLFASSWLLFLFPMQKCVEPEALMHFFMVVDSLFSCRNACNMKLLFASSWMLFLFPNAEMRGT